MAITARFRADNLPCRDGRPLPERRKNNDKEQKYDGSNEDHEREMEGEYLQKYKINFC
jgi:hypothetical protein